MNGLQVVVEIESTEKIHILKSEDWESRSKISTEILCDLMENWPEWFVGKTAAISFGDLPPKADWVDQFDFSFCTTKRFGEPSPCLPFPCPYSLRWPAVGIPDAEELLESMLADDSPILDERMFWIGAETHVSRRALWQLGQEHPQRFYVELMEWDRKAQGGQRSKTRQVPLSDHRKFKYLIDCPGYGYSARLKWLLAAGRPVFVVERENVEHWHEEMQPWVHYVPVAADLSDLLEHYERLERDAGLYEEIGRNGREFAAARLRVNEQLIRTAEAVAEFHKSQPKQPRKPHAMPQKKAAMVVARYAEDLEWIDSLPTWIQVFIINKGKPIPDGTFRRQDPVIERRANIGRETDSYLTFIENGDHTGYEWVIFTQGDPFVHSPDFLGLLEKCDQWKDIQPLSCLWQVAKNLPPGPLVQEDTENWIGGLQVRKELFSLHSFGTIRYHDPGVSNIFNDYLKFHQVQNGTNLAEHFFKATGLPALAEQAHAADLGNFCFGAIFAVRGSMIDQIPLESIRTMRRLSQRDHVHAYVMERLWLHLFGEPFLHPKPPEAARAASALGGISEETGEYWNHHTIVLRELVALMGAKSYLEIGTGAGGNFAAIPCPHKVGIEPEPPEDAELIPAHLVTSDEFFTTNAETFDVIFIDGLHHADQVERDLRNALEALEPGGVIVCHDLNPTTEAMQIVPRSQREWTGDGWKSWIKLRKERPDLCMFVMDADYGLGIILEGGTAEPGPILPCAAELKWPTFAANRREWLNLISPTAAKELVVKHFAKPRPREHQRSRESASTGHGD